MNNNTVMFTRIISIIILLLFVSFITLGCATSHVATNAANSNSSIDRTVIGKLTAIDDDIAYKYATLHYSNGLHVRITRQSLTSFRVANAFINTWTYKFHFEAKYMDGTRLYSVVSVSNMTPDYIDYSNK